MPIDWKQLSGWRRRFWRIARTTVSLSLEWKYSHFLHRSICHTHLCVGECVFLAKAFEMAIDETHPPVAHPQWHSLGITDGEALACCKNCWSGQFWWKECSQSQWNTHEWRWSHRNDHLANWDNYSDSYLYVFLVQIEGNLSAAKTFVYWTKYSKWVRAVRFFSIRKHIMVQSFSHRRMSLLCL